MQITWRNIWHLTVPMKSHKAQLEAMHNSKQSDFKDDFGGKAKVLANKRKPARATISSAIGREDRPSNDFERPVAAEHT